MLWKDGSGKRTINNCNIDPCTALLMPVSETAVNLSTHRAVRRGGVKAGGSSEDSHLGRSLTRYAATSGVSLMGARGAGGRVVGWWTRENFGPLDGRQRYEKKTCGERCAECTVTLSAQASGGHNADCIRSTLLKLPNLGQPCSLQNNTCVIVGTSTQARGSWGPYKGGSLVSYRGGHAFFFCTKNMYGIDCCSAKVRGGRGGEACIMDHLLHQQAAAVALSTRGLRSVRSSLVRPGL